MHKRKMIAAFSVLSLLLAGCSSGKTAVAEQEEIQTAEPEPTAKEKAQELLLTMSTEDKAAQLVHMAVRTWNSENFTEMNDEVYGLFAKYEFGGICLFAENITADNAMTVRLTQSLQKAATENGRIPLLISADQEGGSIFRLQGGTTTPGNMALAATGSTECARQAADIIGSEMRALGFNTDFAPDTDINSNPANSVIGVRSFSDDAQTVVSFSQAYVQGLSDNNIIAAIKHFPGHGDTDVDSHTGLPRIDKSKSELESSDLIPFRKLISAGFHDMVMTAHIQFPQIETGTYTSKYDGAEINLPATLSKAFLTDIVRDEMGFDGVVITDAMLMDAISVHFDPMDAAALALNAGVDMLLMPVHMNGSQTLAEIDSYMSGLTAMIEEGKIPMSRVDEAVTRILTLKYEKGIMDCEYSDTVTEKMAASADQTAGSSAHLKKESEIAAQAVTVLENSGVLPLQAEEDMSFILCGMNQAQANALGYGFSFLQEQGVIPGSAHADVISGEWSNNYGAVYESLDQTNVLILTDFMWSPTLIDPAVSDQLPNVTELIDTAKAAGVRVIAVSAGLPYDLPFMNRADALLAVYSQIGLPSVSDGFRPAGAYGPNLPAAMEIIFGVKNPSGKLPVDIPALSGNTFSAEKIYTRGEGLAW